MLINKAKPIEYPLGGIVPGQVVNVKFKTGAGTISGTKMNVSLFVHYLVSLKGRSTDMVSSGIQSVVLDGRDNYEVALIAPQFKITNVVKMVVYITTDSYNNINIDDLGINKNEDINKLDGVGIDNMGKGTFVGGAGGWVGKDPLVPGINFDAGLSGISIAFDEIKKKIKEKYSGSSGGGGIGSIDVICEGLMLGNSGFAKAMRNITYGLDRCGCKVKSIILDGDNIKSSSTMIGQRVVALSAAPRPSFGFYITMNFPLGVGMHPGFINIPWIMYETVDFPKVFVDHLKTAGIYEVWTPSNFCRDSMIRGGLDEKIVKVMHLGVDTEMFSREKADEPRYIPGNLGGELAGKFKFLTVMGYSERKGVNILIRAFVEEFIDCKDVVLYFKGGWYDANRARTEIETMIIDIPVNRRPLIVFDFNIYPDDVLASLYKGCDCFVLASRGEGWSLPLIEAMSMGMPAIGTRWSGNLEFMNDDNSYLIDVEGFGVEPRCNWVTHYYINQQFAIPSKNHLRQLMRHVYEHRDEAKAKGLRAREWIVNNFDWKISCDKAKKRMEEIISV